MIARICGRCAAMGLFFNALNWYYDLGAEATDVYELQHYSTAQWFIGPAILIAYSYMVAQRDGTLSGVDGTLCAWPRSYAASDCVDLSWEVWLCVGVTFPIFAVGVTFCREFWVTMKGKPVPGCPGEVF